MRDERIIPVGQHVCCCLVYSNVLGKYHRCTAPSTRHETRHRQTREQTDRQARQTQRDRHRHHTFVTVRPRSPRVYCKPKHSDFPVSPLPPSAVFLFPPHKHLEQNRGAAWRLPQRRRWVTRAVIGNHTRAQTHTQWSPSRGNYYSADTESNTLSCAQTPLKVTKTTACMIHKHTHTMYTHLLHKFTQMPAEFNTLKSKLARTQISSITLPNITAKQHSGMQAQAYYFAWIHTLYITYSNTYTSYHDVNVRISSDHSTCLLHFIEFSYM